MSKVDRKQFVKKARALVKALDEAIWEATEIDGKVSARTMAQADTWCDSLEKYLKSGDKPQDQFDLEYQAALFDFAQKAHRELLAEMNGGGS